MSKKLNIPQSTLDAQGEASNPAYSAWVAANAGSGKTHVLTQRVIRLMLAGSSPDRILCLTFTKAAAANMKNRVFETLSKWTMMDNEGLARELTAVLGGQPKPRTVTRARQLFTAALDTPGGLKIQTIHAFCESLLHQFPLEANVPGHFEVMSETAQASMIDDAKSQVLGSQTDSETADAFAALISTVNDQEIERGISDIISKRHKFTEWLVEAGGDLDTAVQGLYPALGISAGDTRQSIMADCIRYVGGHDEALREICALATLEGGRDNTRTAHTLQAFAERATSSDEQVLQALRDGLFTKSKKLSIQKRFLTKAVTDQLPFAAETLQICAEKVDETFDKISALEAIHTSRNMFVIAKSVLTRFERMKRTKGLVDFDDQIERCVALLYRTNIRDWIRFRLDQGVDHVLVDEAQDTSPAQWKIINAICDDFFAGEAASAFNRTQFVVGDEKQSIYSFQGAEPAEFAHQELELKSKAGSAFRKTKLALSFRSTPDVLKAVDRVFENPDNVKGLTHEMAPPPHDAIRSAEPGEVFVWPLSVQSEEAQPENWLDPIDKQGDHVLALAERISKTVKEWHGKPLPGSGEPLKYGDILVLVRKRDRFIPALTRTMKDMGVEVAGADRLKLLEHIAVEDMLAVGKFALLPDDDLNLAAVLKSIFFGCTEDELFALAHGRGTASLIDTIRMAANDEIHAGHEPASRLLPGLEQLLTKGRTLSPFDFYAWLLSAHDGRKKILARLGAEAEDVLDAFLDEVLTFTYQGGLGLDVFISELTKANPEIKREVDLERDEVRILTVHASKGLEAKVVFLVDPCSAVMHSTIEPRLLTLAGDGEVNPFVWMPRGAVRPKAVTEVIETQKELAGDEYRRLLYVGMTRAADRLVVCGYHGKKEAKHRYWHRMVLEALREDAEEILDENGEVSAYRWVEKERTAVPAVSQDAGGKTDEASLPDWVTERVKADAPLPRPLTPSGASALIDEHFKDGARPAFETASSLTNAAEYGNAMHKLLEVITTASSEEHDSVAKKLVGHLTVGWKEEDRNLLLHEANAMLGKPEYKTLFSDHGQNEVSVVGEITTRSGKKRISGQIDRMIVGDEMVSIIDYKTNRLVPEHDLDTPSDYVAQLALYRHLISEIYPDKKIKCALLWTCATKLQELPDELLDVAMEQINNG